MNINCIRVMVEYISLCYIYNYIVIIFYYELFIVLYHYNTNVRLKIAEK